MNEKSTEELEKILGSTHSVDIGRYLKEQGDQLYDDKRPFTVYNREVLGRKNIRQQDAFIQADIPERYGYKLLSGEKKTKQRDIILRICYSCRFTLEETQKALRLYGMAPLYARIPRDALLMTLFNDHKLNVLEINALLKENKMEPLRSCGMQE